MTDESPTKADETPVSIDLAAREAGFRLGALKVTPAIREVAEGDIRETLEPRVMQALVALARRNGEGDRGREGRGAAEEELASEGGVEAVHLREDGVRDFLAGLFDVHPPVEVQDAVVEAFGAVEQGQKAIGQLLHAFGSFAL